MRAARGWFPPTHHETTIAPSNEEGIGASDRDTERE